MLVALQFLLSLCLVVVSLFAILLVMMQRPSDGGGFGTSIGGGAMESAFGGDAGGALVRGTVRIVIAFFLLSLSLSLLHIVNAQRARRRTEARLPDIAAIAETKSPAHS